MMLPEPEGQGMRVRPSCPPDSKQLSCYLSLPDIFEQRLGQKDLKPPSQDLQRAEAGTGRILGGDAPEDHLYVLAVPLHLTIGLWMEARGKVD